MSVVSFKLSVVSFKLSVVSFPGLSGETRDCFFAAACGGDEVPEPLQEIDLPGRTGCFDRIRGDRAANVDGVEGL